MRRRALAALRKAGRRGAAETIDDSDAAPPRCPQQLSSILLKPLDSTALGREALRRAGPVEDVHVDPLTADAGTTRTDGEALNELGVAQGASVQPLRDDSADAAELSLSFNVDRRQTRLGVGALDEEVASVIASLQQLPVRTLSEARRRIGSAMPVGSVPLHEPHEALQVACMRAGMVKKALQAPKPVAKDASDQGGEEYQEWVAKSSRAVPRLSAATWNAELPDDAPDFHTVLFDMNAKGKFLTDRHVSSLLQLMMLRWQQELPTAYRFLYLPVEAVREVVHGFSTALAFEAAGTASVGVTSYISLFLLLRSVSPSRWLHLYVRFREMVTECVRSEVFTRGVDRKGTAWCCRFTYRRQTSPRGSHSMDITGQVSRAYLHLLGAAGRTHLENLHRHPHVWSRFLPTFPGVLMRDFEAFGFSPTEAHRRRAFVAHADLGLFAKCVSMVDMRRCEVGEAIVPPRAEVVPLARRDGPTPDPRQWTVPMSSKTAASLASATRGPADLAALVDILDRTGMPRNVRIIKALGRAAKVNWAPPDSALAAACAEEVAVLEAKDGPVTFNKGHWRADLLACGAQQSVEFETSQLAVAVLGKARLGQDGTSHRLFGSADQACVHYAPPVPEV